MPSIPSEYERLFLLEFYVESIAIQTSSLNQTESSLCVTFQFLHYPPMHVCEEDFSPKTKPRSECRIHFKSGKSCLFSLHPDENNEVPCQFDLTITVNQKITNQCNDKVEKLLVGKAVVRLGGSFANLMRAKDSSTLPTTGVRHGEFPLMDKDDNDIGTVVAFVRLSCFGKLIVTQFQLAGDDSMNYMFKGTDPAKIFKEDDTAVSKHRPSGQEDRNMTDDELQMDAPYDKVFGYPTESEEGDEMHEECRLEEPIVEDEYEEEEGAPPSERQMTEKEEQPEEENYREIGAEINGHSIVIRVLKKRKKPKKSADDANCLSQMGGLNSFQGPCQCQPPPPCPNAPKLNVCDCDYPLPPELMNPPCTCSQPPTPCCQDTPPTPFPLGSQQLQMGFPQQQNSMQAPMGYPMMQNIPNPQTCPKEDCPLGLYTQPQPNPLELEPGTVAMKGDQVFFQMANRRAGEPVNEKERKLANSLYFTVGSTEGGDNPKTMVQITPQHQAESITAGGTVSGLPIDTSKQDMFLLKLQQTSDNVDNKSKLEMELRTPKSKEPKPDSDTKDTQCLATDFPPAEKKGKGKADKKKK